MEISEKIKYYMQLRKLSYSQLSKLTGISKSSLQRYATGTTNKIPIEAVYKIEKSLSLEKGTLMGWIEEREKLGKRVKAKREEIGLTQFQLAKKMGNISVKYLNEIEEGNYIEEELPIFKLANALNVDIDYIYGLEYTEEELNELEENEIIQHFKLLNSIGKEKAKEYIIDLSEQEKYTKEN